MTSTRGRTPGELAGLPPMHQPQGREARAVASNATAWGAADECASGRTFPATLWLRCIFRGTRWQASLSCRSDGRLGVDGASALLPILAMPKLTPAPCTASLA